MSTEQEQKKDEVTALTFEEAIGQLKEIVARIEQGEIPLQDSLEQYEKGMVLIRHCRGILQKAEKRIEILLKNSKGELEARELLEEREDEREEDAADEDAGDEYGNAEAPQPAAPRTPEKPGSGQEDLPF